MAKKLSYPEACHWTYSRAVRSCLAAFCLLAASVSLADSNTDANKSGGLNLIEKMSVAGQELNYSGAFVFAHGGELETMRIYHSKAGGVEREKLLSLNGEAREIIRNAHSIVCIWPGSKTLAVGKSTPRTPFPEFAADQLALLQQLYSFEHNGMDRVAGRQAEIVDIIPMDNYRYGYRLWIDAETFLMLRSVMSDHRGKIIEQVMFTEVNYSDSISPAMFRASVEGERQEWLVDHDQPVETLVPEVSIPGVDNVNTPEGFALVSDMVMVLPEESVVRRVMYSDGLASLSIYIASSVGNDELLGLSGMGAVHAYGVTHSDWHVTVVGEVPKTTVKMLGDTLTLAAR